MTNNKVEAMEHKEELALDRDNKEDTKTETIITAVKTKTSPDCSLAI